MLFLIPDPATWTDPGPAPYSRLWRLLTRRERYETRHGWIAVYERYLQRLEREREAWELYQKQMANYEAMMAEYERQGEEMAEQLPFYLHKLRLSHWRKVQEKKTERVREHVDYCLVESWYFDEMAYFFKIDTYDLPHGLSIAHFREPEVADTLSVNFLSKTSVEVNARNHQRPGLWIVVEHQAGRGLVPTWVNYTDMAKAIPKTAPPLVFSAGVGAHNKALFYDLDEIYTVLIAGQKGSGKSQKINAILCTWLQRATPNEVRLFLTDLKGGLELYDYNGVPHLGGDIDLTMRAGEDEESEPVRLGQQVLEDPHEVPPVLNYMEQEMKRRQQLLKHSRARKISVYNKRHKKEPLSRWVLVIDELATLADSDYRKASYKTLAELIRKGRAVGIYAIIATQVPDKTVLTRQLAGNLDFRMVGYLADGASSGLALGDNSYDATRLPPDVRGRCICRWNHKEQVQSPYISDMTIARIVAAAKHGQQTSAQEAEDTSLAQEIFEYALNELGGFCDERELFKHFRNRIARSKLRSILKTWELSGNNGDLGPTITIEGDDYYLLPATLGGDGKSPRKLTDVIDYENQENPPVPPLRQEPGASDTPDWVGEVNSKAGRPAPVKTPMGEKGN